jgi:hypothetical protein
MCLICSPGQGEYLLNIWCTSKVLVVDRGSMFCNKIRGRMFFFFLTLMSKGEKRVREESRVRMHVGACVSINAKGGDCWKIF